ncbi:MAG: MFS transporter [bacterium]
MLPVKEYLAFALSHPRFLGFGFLLAFTSSAGQTYFIGIFGPEVREAFELSHTEWGFIYMVGTLCSAALLPWSGHLIDRFDLKIYTAAVVVGLVIACVVMSLTPGPLFLILSIFMLRQFGQGLSSHTAITSMARYMRENRGKAIAISSMGYSFGEATLPFVAVIVIAMIGWRSTYLLVAGCVLGLLPVILVMLRGHEERHQAHIEALALEAENDQQGTASKTRREMLSEGRFYLLLPALLAPSYVATGLFFHHLTLADSKLWSGAWVTGNYWVYALCSISASLISGPLIDRFTAARVVRFYLVPMILALLLLVPAKHSAWVVPYMALIGINTGIYFTTFSSIWAELYGTRFIGSIKSLIGALGVLASALGPVSIGWLLDAGFSFEQICVLFACFCAVATVLLILGLRRYRTN